MGTKPMVTADSKTISTTAPPVKVKIIQRPTADDASAPQLPANRQAALDETLPGNLQDSSPMKGDTLAGGFGLQVTAGNAQPVAVHVRVSSATIEQTSSTVPLGDNLHVKGQLGAGGMGEVYAAHERTLNREVAVKVLTKKVAATAIARQRFLREDQ